MSATVSHCLDKKTGRCDCGFVLPFGRDMIPVWRDHVIDALAVTEIPEPAPESPTSLSPEQQIRLESMRMATTAFKDYHQNGHPWGAGQFITVAQQFEEYIK